MRSNYIENNNSEHFNIDGINSLYPELVKNKFLTRKTKHYTRSEIFMMLIISMLFINNIIFLFFTIELKSFSHTIGQDFQTGLTNFQNEITHDINEALAFLQNNFTLTVKIV